MTRDFDRPWREVGQGTGGTYPYIFFLREIRSSAVFSFRRGVCFRVVECALLAGLKGRRCRHRREWSNLAIAAAEGGAAGAGGQWRSLLDSPYTYDLD